MRHHANTFGYLVSTLLISLFLLIEAKAAPLSTLKKLKKGLYEENLAVYRMAFCKAPKAVKKAPNGPLVCPLDQTDHLAHRLAQRKAAYAVISDLKGYTIQLYSGNSRTGALRAQDLASTFAYPAKLHYRRPYYTVQLGFFGDRLEAYFVHLTLIRKIPTAMIRPCMRAKSDYLAINLHPDASVSPKDIAGVAVKQL